MFDLDVSYPKGVASSDYEGVGAAIDWCLERMQYGDHLTVWTSQKNNLRPGSKVYDLVHRYSDVDHITGLGSSFVRSRGPVLMAWAFVDDIGKLVQAGGNRITALCVMSWNDEWLRPWVEAVRPDVLGDSLPWGDEVAGIGPVVVEALRGFTMVINHNNAISAGFEKDAVVSGLLALHDAHFPMDADAIPARALANGWSGRNPQRLAKCVVDIQAATRPRTPSRKGLNYVEQLRARAYGAL